MFILDSLKILVGSVLLEAGGSVEFVSRAGGSLLELWPALSVGVEGGCRPVM